MSSRLSVRLLGEFCLLVDGQPCHELSRPRRQALLAYLLLHRHAPQPRRRIAFAFWPDSSEGQAHTNLRKLFFQVRRALPHADRCLFADTQTIGWRPDAPCTFDVAELERALEQLEQQAAPDNATVEQVIALYAGELLPGCYDEWLLPLRRALHERVLRALEQALARLEAQHTYATGVRAAEHLLRLDPLHEAAYRQLMHFRALTGDRAGALRVYHECVRMLAQELEVEPTAETEALYRRLLAGEGEPAPSPGPAAARQTHVPLVGRAAEWQALRRAWQGAAQGGPRMLAVWGEAGVGKTRLVEELVRWARLRPGSVAYARAYAAEGALAYAPLTEWLRSPALRPGLERLADVWRSELARLLPELLAEPRDGQPALPPPPPLGEGGQRQRFYEALARTVLAAPSPCLLVLDDLQWCDGETLAWLRYLLRHDTRAPLLLVGTVRREAVSEAADPEHPLHKLRLQLEQAGQWSELSLAPLSEGETTELAGHLAQGDAAAWAALLYRETEGNPLFVVEMVRAGAPAALLAGEAVALPHTVQAVIEERLGRLSPHARRLSELAAAFGRAFSVEELAAASELDDAALVQVLDELWQRNVVREQGAADYDFSHDKLREVAYRRPSRLRRRLLHQRIGDALAQLHAGRLDAVAGELAVHAEEAGQTRQAIDHLRRAAQVAQAVGAYPEMAARLRKALALLPSLSLPPETALEQELALLSPLGTALLALHGYGSPAVEAIYGRAYALCLQRPNDPHLMPVLVGLALFYMIRGDLHRALAIARQSLEQAEHLQDDGLLLEAHAVVGPILQYLGEFRASVPHLEQALALYDPARHGGHAAIYGQDPGVVARALLAVSLWQVGHADRALALAREALELAQTVSHPYSLNLAQSFTAHLHHLRQEPAAALPAARAGVEYAYRYGFQYWLAVTTMFCGWATVRLGGASGNAADASPSAAESLAQMQAAYAGFKQSGAGLFRGYYLSILAETQAAARLPKAAWASLEEALATVDQTDDRFWLAELQRLRGELLLAQADAGQAAQQVEAEAEAAFRQALQTAQAQGARFLELRAAVSLARLWARQGRSANTRALLEPICKAFAEGWDTPDLHAARTLLDSPAQTPRAA